MLFLMQCVSEAARVVQVIRMNWLVPNGNCTQVQVLWVVYSLIMMDRASVYSPVLRVALVLEVVTVVVAVGGVVELPMILWCGESVLYHLTTRLIIPSQSLITAKPQAPVDQEATHRIHR